MERRYQFVVFPEALSTTTSASNTFAPTERVLKTTGFNDHIYCVIISVLVCVLIQFLLVVGVCYWICRRPLSPRRRRHLDDQGNVDPKNCKSPTSENISIIFV